MSQSRVDRAVVSVLRLSEISGIYFGDFFIWSLFYIIHFESRNADEDCVSLQKEASKYR